MEKEENETFGGEHTGYTDIELCYKPEIYVMFLTSVISINKKYKTNQRQVKKNRTILRIGS